ncbi:Thiamine biosynthesis lipoprotein ApbE precursor [Anaerohalosphaera lusitana]|uniref:FAD:protein FMN transferase n=1 Tax=Anaerohalosphaera lusitana TaxID=1936003 RepID=A0A1U9NQX2_9BACT|nr:FAD:protein FMN transferase [Anaerohalosphaera lusitana]AQT70323.1 Thiamine biosynthesis lipoprotein ApbE precursor [Anaerohalosphaera lusitana]
MAESGKRFGWLSTLAGAVVVIAAAFGLRFLFAPGLVDRKSGYREVMGTFAQVVAVAEDGAVAKEAVEAGWDALVRVDELMSGYKEDSDVSRINREAGDGPVKVDEAVVEVIEEAVRYSEMTDGAFDVTVGPEIELWREAEKKGEVPNDEEIATVRERVGYEKLEVDEEANTVEFAVEGMRIDLGGIAKGYGIDAAVEAMKEAGAVGGMVDVGGDIRVFGVRGEKDEVGEWNIGLQNPVVEKGVLAVLKLQDAAIATSGDYRRYVEIGGKRYSHIFSPAEGGSATELTSVTVIAGEAVEADALATAVSVMGMEKGLQLVEGLAGVEAIVMRSGTEELVYTSGAEAYVERVVE